MDLEIVAQALRSRDRVRLLKLLARDAAGASEVHRRYESEFRHRRNRVSVYRDLEILVHAGLLDKRYDGDEKRIVYQLPSRRLTIDLVSHIVERV